MGPRPDHCLAVTQYISQYVRVWFANQVEFVKWIFQNYCMNSSIYYVYILTTAKPNQDEVFCAAIHKWFQVPSFSQILARMYDDETEV